MLREYELTRWEDMKTMALHAFLACCLLLCYWMLAKGLTFGKTASK